MKSSFIMISWVKTYNFQIINIVEDEETNGDELDRILSEDSVEGETEQFFRWIKTSSNEFKR